MCSKCKIGSQDICDAIEEGVTVADYERKSKAAMDDHGPDQDRGSDAVTIVVIVAGLLFMIYEVLSSFVPSIGLPERI